MILLKKKRYNSILGLKTNLELYGVWGMLGTIVNSLAVVGGSIIGMLVKGGLSEKVSKTVMDGLALCVLFIGVSNIIGVSGKLDSNGFLVVIISIVVGGGLGEKIDIDKAVENLGKNIEVKLKGKGGQVAQGFVTSSLLFCIGAMAIIGSLESGLSGNHKTLFAKSVLDGISSIVFSSSLGIGVMISAVSVFLYQGLITLGASFLKGILIEGVITNMTAIGGILIIALSLNMLGTAKIKVANLLPAIFLPIVYQVVLSLIR
ncbi:MAG: putative membrane protein YdfK [Clostridium sp.]